jgi:transcriptional repressor NrdR
MRCPVCEGGTKVLDSRDGKGEEIRRRRVCNECGHRFTTRERIDEVLPYVVKRSGERQPFDRRKLLASLQIACRKRPVSPEVLEQSVRQIEKWAATRGERGVSSEAVGEQIMHQLYGLDQVAYIRFVSVYQSFETVEEFEHLLHEIDKAERVDIEGQRTLFSEMGEQARSLPGLVRKPEDDGTAS